MKKEMTFTTAFDKFEKILQELDSGNLSLEETINKIEEGAALYKICAKMLSKAKNTIITINKELEEEKDIA